MSKGKANPGAGRPKGSKNKRTLAAEAMREQILAEGKSPLEVMVDGMRTALERAAKLKTDLEKFALPADADAEKIKALVELHAESRRYIMAAHECAKDAAPYLHPKLANLTVEGSVTHTWEDLLAQLDDPDHNAEAEEWTTPDNQLRH